MHVDTQNLVPIVYVSVKTNTFAFQDGMLNKTELNQRKQRLEQERQTIAERSEQIQRQQKQQSVKAQIIGEFSAFCASAQKALENPTPEVKQEVLRLLVESIAVEDNAITIKHIIPTDDNSRLLPRGIVPKTPIKNLLIPIIFVGICFAIERKLLEGANYRLL